jgi:O-antigen/teichoic acid export membrane protein
MSFLLGLMKFVGQALIGVGVMALVGGLVLAFSGWSIGLYFLWGLGALALLLFGVGTLLVRPFSVDARLLASILLLVSSALFASFFLVGVVIPLPHALAFAAVVGVVGVLSLLSYRFMRARERARSRPPARP